MEAETLEHSLKDMARSLQEYQVFSETMIEMYRGRMKELVMSEDTNWKWQWCVLRMSSNQFIAALSENFDTAEKAQEWMTNEIAKIIK